MRTAEKTRQGVAVVAKESSELGDPPSGQILFDPRDADRTSTAAVMAEERCTDAEDAVDLLFVIDGESSPTHRGKLGDEG